MTSSTDKPELTISRTFDAPLELVWRVWTQPEHAKQWWGPDGFSAPRFESDLRAGGAVYIEMQAADGTIYPNSGVYEEVIPLERIVFTDVADIDEVPAFSARTVITFEERDGKTTVTAHQTYWNVTEAGKDAIGGAQEGWTQMLNRFAAYLREQR